MSKNATGPQVDQNREDDGQLAHQARPKAVGHEADNLRVIPSGKIQGQRMGQLISNALYKEYKSRWRDGVSTEEFHQKMFYLENDELERIVQNFLADQSWIRADDAVNDLRLEHPDTKEEL